MVLQSVVCQWFLGSIGVGVWVVGHPRGSSCLTVRLTKKNVLMSIIFTPEFFIFDTNS
jgi:hypothetical protein